MEIYKYCPPKRNHLTNLKNAELWFSSPNDFDDKLDSNLPTTEIDIKILVEQYLKELSNIPKDVIKNLMPPKGLFSRNNNSQVLSQKNLMHNFRQDCIGITCFTENGNSLKMWNEFASNEKGFCLCFETNCDDIFFKGLGKVDYLETLPIVDNSSTNLADELKINFLTKLSKYNFEEEQRLIKFESGSVKFEKMGLKEVILGRQISNYTKKRIEKIVRENYSHEILIRKSN
jgi:hypothetical protein